MATSTLADIAVTGTWQDVITTHASAASVDVLIQNVGGGDVSVVFGGASDPAQGTNGVALEPLDSMTGNSDHIWIKTNNAINSRISVTLL